MSIKEQIIKDLIKHEGKETYVYKDNSKEKIETIGVGRNLRHVGLSEDEIMLLLNNDIDRVEKQLDKYYL